MEKLSLKKRWTTPKIIIMEGKGNIKSGNILNKTEAYTVNIQGHQRTATQVTKVAPSVYIDACATGVPADGNIGHSVNHIHNGNGASMCS